MALITYATDFLSLSFAESNSEPSGYLAGKC